MLGGYCELTLLTSYVISSSNTAIVTHPRVCSGRMMVSRATMWADQTDYPRQDSSRIQVMMDNVNPITLDDEMMLQWHHMQEMGIIIPDDPGIIHRLLEDLPELPDDIVATSLDLFPSLQPPDSCTPTTISPTDVTSPVHTAINVTSSGSSSTANDDPPNPTIGSPPIISLVRDDDDDDDDDDDADVDFGSPANTSLPIVSSRVNKKATDRVRSSTRMKKKSCCNPSPKAKKSRTELLVKELASEGEVQIEAKEVRRASQAEHIKRERQRRDEMAAKYTHLETLLPPAPKRERAVVVEDTMLLVKNLQHRKEELLKKRAQLKHTVSTHEGLAPWGSSHCNKNRKLGATTTTHGTVCETGSPLSSFMDLMMRPTEIMKSTCPPGSGNYAPNLSNTTSCKDNIITPITCNDYTSCVKTLRIHAGLPDEIVIDMVCGRPPSNLHSLLIHTVELVCLELTNFSLHRISHELVHCKISGKSRLQHGRPDLQSSPMSKVAALQTALERI